MFHNRVIHDEQVELDMYDLDVIFGMNCSYSCFASIDCRTSLVKFNFPNEPILEWKGRGEFFS